MEKIEFDEKMTIIDLLSKVEYYLPDYQRGYRWEKKHIEDLLNDLHEFYEFSLTEKFGENDFYCMQSLILSYNTDKQKYGIIDGQQRLTTMYILFSFLIMKKDLKNVDLKDFEYESRSDSGDFLSGLKDKKPSSENSGSKKTKNTTIINMEDEKEIKNRDIFYMANAYNAIYDLYINKYNEDFTWLVNLINSDNIKFIIQDNSESVDNENAKSVDNNNLESVDNDNSESSDNSNSKSIVSDIELFNSINSGKIPLTDEELIRAKIIIQCNDIQEEDLIAKKWDEIEHSLQNDSFWYFLQNDSQNDASRISLIFSTIADKIYKMSKDEKYVATAKDKKYVAIAKDIETEWKKIGDSDKSSHMLYRFLQKYRLMKNNNDAIGIEKGDTFKDATSIRVFWNEVKTIYEVFNKWYGDVELYNYIGQVMYIKNKENEENIIGQLMDEYASKSKYEFIVKLKETIRKSFGDSKKVWPCNNYKYEECIDDKGNKVPVFQNLWYSGRSEEPSKEDKNKLKVKQDKDAVINFLLWSNCEYLNEQLKNEKYEMFYITEKQNSKKTDMKDTIIYNSDIQMERYRFPFDVFKIKGADIEHVDSYIDQAEDEDFWSKESKKKDREKWCENIIEILTPTEKDDLKKELEKITIPRQLSEDEKTSAKAKIENPETEKWLFKNVEGDVHDDDNPYLIFRDCVVNNMLGENIELADNIDVKWEKNFNPDRRKIGNLTLLDPNINRGYGNKPFRLKRKDVIEKSFAGKYVYPCTRLVFLKEFDSKSSKLTSWNQDDFKKYRSFLANLYVYCFWVDMEKTDKEIKAEIKRIVKDEKKFDIKLFEFKRIYLNKSI